MKKPQPPVPPAIRIINSLWGERKKENVDRFCKGFLMAFVAALCFVVIYQILNTI